MRILLVVYDNDSYIHWFPQGIAYIAAVLKKEGYDVDIYAQDVHHYPEEHLTDFLNKNMFDIVGVGVIGGYYQYHKLLKISQAINRSKNRPFFILGGHGPSPAPEYFLNKSGADAIIMGEGEISTINLVKAIENKQPLSSIPGIAWKNSNEIVINPAQPLIKDINTIPWPAYELFEMHYYRLLRMPHCLPTDFIMPVLSGRGCTFRCNFCYRMDKGFRPRSSENIIEEIRFLAKNYGITYVAFSDELLMSSKARTISLCEDMIKADLKIKWTCNGRLNFATPEVLKVMKKAGCTFINYGIEAYDDQILKNMNKVLTTEIIEKGIKATLAEGISPGYNIIWGNIGETVETLNKGVEFLLKYDDGAQMRTIRPVTPYPGSPLFDYAVEKNLIRDISEFYEKKHQNSDLVSVNFTNLTDAEFHKALFEANTRLMNNYFENLRTSYIKTAKKLYLENDTSFRGFRQT
jgi:anaerobic magnesium-protoporphyrin IX monomethyl ester cyclase